MKRFIISYALFTAFSCSMIFAQKVDYPKAWDKVAVFEQKGLPKSALEQTDKIFAQALKEKNQQQLIKGMIYKMKYKSTTEDGNFVKNLNYLESQLDSVDFPAKPVLHSMLAEMYWWYYQNNRYRFQDRTQTANFDSGDINTWDLDRIVKTVISHYDKSLEKPEKLKSISVKVFEQLLLSFSDKDTIVRPTLYDFLANRALDFYMNEEAGLTKPIEEFNIDNDEFFKETAEFVNLKLFTTDTLSFNYKAIAAFQDLIRLHLSDKRVDALADIELRRLAFIYKKSKSQLKDNLYLNALETLEKKYQNTSVAAEIGLKIAETLNETGNDYNPLKSVAHKWDKKKAYAKANEVLALVDSKKDSSIYQALKSLIDVINNKSLKVTIEKENIPGRPFRALIEYTNLDKVFVSVYSITYSDLDEISKAYDKTARDKYIDRDEFIINYYKNKPTISKFTVAMPNDGDFQKHSAEIKLPALDKGIYFIKISSAETDELANNCLSFGYTAITNISYISRMNNDKSADFYFLSRETGQPLVNAEVMFYEDNYDYTSRKREMKLLGKQVTDENGFIHFVHGASNNAFQFTVRYKDDFWKPMSQDILYPRTLDMYTYYSVENSTKNTRTFFFTDRSIYRPGQTIYFKGIVLSADNKNNADVLPKYSTTVTLRDANYQEVAKQDFVTNEFGSFNGSFTAPSGGMNGLMTIENNFGSIQVSVEEYKRPKFEVVFDTLREAYKLGDTIVVKGFAKSYSGVGVDNATVKYRITRNTQYPWAYKCWWLPIPQGSDKEIANGTVNVANDGSYEIRFNAQPDNEAEEASNPLFSFTVNADVTDVNGETHSGSVTIKLGFKALTVQVDVPNELDKNGKGEFKINTSNTNGDFVSASGKIEVYKLVNPDKPLRKRNWVQPDTFTMTKAEYQSNFPNDVYKDEDNPATWKTNEKTLEIAFNTEKEKALRISNLKNWKDGMYKLVITSADKYGKTVEGISIFTVYDSKGKKLPVPVADLFSAIKSEGEPGDTAKLLIGSGYQDVKVLYEIEYDDKIVQKEWLSLNSEQRTLNIPIKEEYRGDIGINCTFIYNNRLYKHSQNITVPFTNKMLDINFETFRNKLQPGEKEKWRLKINGKNGDKVAAEMVASLYDASLDAFKPHRFDFGIYNSYYPHMVWESQNGFDVNRFDVHQDYLNYNGYYRDYYSFNWFEFGYGNRLEYKLMVRGVASGVAITGKNKSAKVRTQLEDSVMEADGYFGNAEYNAAPMSLDKASEEQSKPDLSSIKARTNLNETAFFYPQLMTDDKGNVNIEFTIPEALTKWKMLGFAHTKDLKYGFTENSLVTQKTLMVAPNAPRFLREGDTLNFTSKITSLSDNDLNGVAQLMLFDALTMKPIGAQLQLRNAQQNFTIKKGESVNIIWPIIIPEGLQAVTYRVVAQAGKFSDGEESSLPVLTNRMLVTETMPLPISGKNIKTFTMDKLAHNQSTTLKNHKLTLEFTNNPAWYAVQALPYLMEYPYECAEQTFSRFYANSIATHIVNSNPRIKQVFESWKNVTPDALLSNLEKNEELKNILLNETPWVREAKDESQRKQRIAVLFDLNKMANELEQALDKLLKMQVSNGGWPWFKGMPDDRYITQHIVCGMGKLDHLGIKSIEEDSKIRDMVVKAIRYTDARIAEDYNELKKLAKANKLKLSDNHTRYTQIHYLYARSFFKNIDLQGDAKDAYNYYLNQAGEYWLTNGIYMQGMIALIQSRNGNEKVVGDIIRSLKEKALHSEEMGMYWKLERGWFWYQAPVETQAMLIEAFNEAAHDQASVNEMKIWLLKQKQTQDWKTTRATTEACYALLKTGSDWLSDDTPVIIKVGSQTVDPSKMPDVKVEAGTGYFKTSWTGSDIKPEMATVTLEKKNEGVSWGALYWQYFEQLDKITSAETPLKLNKKLFVERNTSGGPVITPVTDTTTLKAGDLIKVRIELRVDRDMEYVHMKDMRAAGLEPVNVLSQYKYQDGLWYYESTRDAATNFFFGWLRKGTYVFEYPLRVSLSGNYSNGITTIQSMYAPEFTSHSEGVRIKIK